MWAVKVSILLVVALLALLHYILIEWILNQRIKSGVFFKSLCVIVQSNSQELFIHACSQYLRLRNNNKKRN